MMMLMDELNHVLRRPSWQLCGIAMAILGFISLGSGCSQNGSGSRWPGKTISADDYAFLVKDATPRQSYLQWKAQQENRPLAEIEAADASLSTVSNPYNRSDLDAVSMGRSMYVVHCAACHGVEADGRGQVISGELSRMSFHNSHKRAYVALFGHAPDNWFNSIANGPAGNSKLPPNVAKMPAFETVLAREQIWLLVTYLEQETVHPGQWASSK